MVRIFSFILSILPKPRVEYVLRLRLPDLARVKSPARFQATLNPTSLAALARGNSATNTRDDPQPQGDSRNSSRHEAREPQDRLTWGTTEACVGILQGGHHRHGSRHGRRSFVVADSDGAGRRVDVAGSGRGRFGGTNGPLVDIAVGFVIIRQRSLASASVRPFPFLAQVLLLHAASYTLNGFYQRIPQVRAVCSLRYDGHGCRDWSRGGAAWDRNDISDGLRVRRSAGNAHAR